ncbi:MAG: nuclear transport factor 2 family protein [Blastocatellia bacterium]|nr:nuclear transport factor 2 family protein [Blastocatellia bacterium]
MSTIILLTAFAVCSHVSVLAQKSPKKVSEAALAAEIQAMLIKYDAAQIEFHNGRSAASKALWSHSDDITLSGGAGGAIEKGWKNVSARLDWAAAQYSKGTQTDERINVMVTGNLAFVVRYEHIRFYVPGKSDESERNYRTTIIFRREKGGWRVVHRHADTMMTRQTPR